MTEFSKKVFFTGFPGFIGARLINKLKDDEGVHLTLLVQDRFLSKARRDLEAMGLAEERYTLLKGDIVERHLGLSEEDYSRLAGEITDIFHLAAIYDLAVPEGLAWRVNVGGTARIIDLAYDSPSLRRMIYYSTCYVSGKRTGRIYEHELEMGQEFKNFYESTKNEAEVLVRKAQRDLPIVIIRPSVVVGDSKTGETAKFDGPYFGMIFVEKMNLGVPLPYVGRSDAEINLVPVDFVVDATLAIWGKEGLEGKTLALADPHPMLARDLYARICEIFTGHPPAGHLPPALIQVPLAIKAVRNFLGVPPEVVEYFNHKASYDATQSQDALEGTGVTCPRLTEYMDVMVSYYRQHRDDQDKRWVPY